MDRADALVPPFCPEGIDGDAPVDRHTEQLVEELMSMAEQLIEQVAQKGRAEGRVEGGRTVLLKLLTKRFGSLPEDVVARVTGAEEADLDRWLDRILTAPTLAEVFGRP